MLNTLLKSFDTIVIVATKSSSNTLSVMGIGLIEIPISTAISCGLTIRKNLIHEIVMQKYIKYKKQYEEDQQTIKTFDKFYR